MITFLDLRERMHENPFKPFRIHTSDGKNYDIVNHDMLFLKRSSVEVALDMDANLAADRFAKVAMLHITAIEDLGKVNPV